MDPVDPKTGERVTVMSLFDVAVVTRNADFDLGQKRNAEFTMMLWQIVIGVVLIYHMTSTYFGIYFEIALPL